MKNLMLIQMAVLVLFIQSCSSNARESGNDNWYDFISREETPKLSSYKGYEPGHRYTKNGYVYKTVEKKITQKLQCQVFRPGDLSEGEIRPVIVFFHGGGWTAVGEGSMFQQCRYFAERGWIAVSAEYRLSQHSKSLTTTPTDCIEDAKSAVRWVRANADELQADPDKLVVSGASAGGHLAASTALVPGYNAADDPEGISSVANALILYYPCVNPAADPWYISLFPDKIDFEATSPFHNLDKNAPPMAVFSGTKDNYVPFSSVEKFCEKAAGLGVPCRLHVLEDREHFLFDSDFDYVMKASENFLLDYGFEITD